MPIVARPCRHRRLLAVGEDMALVLPRRPQLDPQGQVRWARKAPVRGSVDGACNRSLDVFTIMGASMLADTRKLTIAMSALWALIEIPLSQHLYSEVMDDQGADAPVRVDRGLRPGLAHWPLGLTCSTVRLDHRVRVFPHKRVLGHRRLIEQPLALDHGPEAGTGTRIGAWCFPMDEHRDHDAMLLV